MALIKKDSQTGTGTIDINVPHGSPVISVQTNVSGTATYSCYYSLNGTDFEVLSGMSSATATAFATVAAPIGVVRCTVESGSGTVTVTVGTATYTVG